MQLKNLDRHIRYFKARGIGLYDKYKLHKMQRYQPFELNFFGKKIKVPDSGSFLGVYQEMFVDEIYKFVSKNNSPLIIDCGSNIGLSVLYFKQKYPKAKIIAFEADPQICEILTHNINEFDLTDIDIHPKAIWTQDGFIEFQIEGGASGMITQDKSSHDNIIKIPSVRLKSLLEEFDVIDFLKIDIEGAEYDVIKDCAGQLHKAQNIFIEYHSMDDKTQQLGELLNILKVSGFRYHITEAFTSKYPFIERKTMMGMDLLLNIYAYK
ncbi:MAG: FkbM family methyltransferase [Saprospiraceae bacterium]|nr:FkbM family methyltransferase [Candidatus Brachybacter algidus]